MFKSTQNIDTAFRSMRMVMLLVIAGCLLISCYALYQNVQLSARVQDRVYVLAGDKAIEVFASNRKDNIAVEARDHVAMFHTFFFSLDPDEKAIAANLKKALYMADGSAKKQYDDLVETGYIAGIISGNISQQITIDSVVVNISAQPYLFRCYATLKIIRPTSAVTRSLITQGYLREIARSDHNPHGFLIERWETLENKDLKIENR
ncbi:MAG: conjugative transposon protein TraK [Chitinophagaceae bacterium]|nr:MAG: conjugative transposon protein TraK [Chitinophagaceae bacterium]